MRRTDTRAVSSRYSHLQWQLPTVYSIFDLSKCVIIRSSSESSKAGSATSVTEEGTFSSTHFKSSSCVLFALLFPFGSCLVLLIFIPSKLSFNIGSFCSSSSSSSDNGEKANLWLFADGRQRIMMTKRIMENSNLQMASSTHSSRQSCSKREMHNTLCIYYHHSQPLGIEQKFTH